LTSLITIEEEEEKIERMIDMYMILKGQ